MERNPNNIRDTRNWGTVDHATGGPNGTPPWERERNIESFWTAMVSLPYAIVSLAMAPALLLLLVTEVGGNMLSGLGDWWREVVDLAHRMPGAFFTMLLFFIVPMLFLIGLGIVGYLCNRDRQRLLNHFQRK